jgi:hypothetical protein
VYAPSCPVASHQWARSARGASYQASGLVDAGARRESQRRVLCMLGAGATGAETASDAAQGAGVQASEGEGWSAARAASSEAQACTQSGQQGGPEGGCPATAQECAAGTAPCRVAAAAAPPAEAEWQLGGVWGLGTQRSLQAFWGHCGVDFAGRAVSDKGAWGGRRPSDFL